MPDTSSSTSPSSSAPSSSAAPSSSSSHGKGEGKWVSTDFTAHSGIIWRLSWAHPEFGQLLASCSEDKTICVWEEQESLTPSATQSSGGGQKEKWLKKVSLSESKTSIKDVKFAPRHLGLKLASASADGCIRIYEATDVFSLNYWQVHDTIEVENTIGTSQESAGSSGRYSSHGLTCISWNDCPFEPAKLAVGGYSKHAAVWTCDRKTGRWVEEVDLGEHNGVVHDIAWAPAMGRSYHQIATACRNFTVRVYMLLRRQEEGSLELMESTPEVPNPAILTCTSPVWRVAWNATGTVLATSGDDGTLSLWRKDFAGQWKMVQNLPSSGEMSTLRSQYKYF